MRKLHGRPTGLVHRAAARIAADDARFGDGVARRRLVRDPARCVDASCEPEPEVAPTGAAAGGNPIGAA